MNDLMIDIEALGGHPDGVITQVAGVIFDRYTGETGDHFNFNISVQDSLNKGLKVDEATLRFWYEQDKQAWFEDGVILVNNACNYIDNFYSKYSNVKIWAHATYDFPMLECMFKKAEKRFPFFYRNIRDIRTLVDLSGIEFKKEEGKDPKSHDALEDCYYQIKYCVDCFNKLKNGK